MSFDRFFYVDEEKYSLASVSAMSFIVENAEEGIDIFSSGFLGGWGGGWLCFFTVFN